MSRLEPAYIEMLCRGQLERTGLTLDPLLLVAIVQAESGCNPWAVRYEKRYRWIVTGKERPVTCSEDTEIELQKTSWGLSQLMGGTARWLGFPGKKWLTELLDPYLNIYWMSEYLKVLRDRYSLPLDIVAAWNAGSARKDMETGAYANNSYVIRVLSKYRLLGGTGIPVIPT